MRQMDSTIAKQAEQFARAAYEPYLFNHAMRTFLSGSLIGKAMKLEWDEELVSLAAIMHDLGLTAQHMGPLPFELSGAQAARAFLHGHGMPTERANVVRRYPRAASRSFMRDIGECYVPGFSGPNICDAIEQEPFEEEP